MLLGYFDPVISILRYYKIYNFLCDLTDASAETTPPAEANAVFETQVVISFAKLNQLFSGYFDPVSNFCHNENK